MFIDTHTHLFSSKFDEDRTEMVQRALDAGVTKLLLPNIDVASIEAMHKLEAAYPQNCYSMMGLHPCDIGADFEEKLAIIKQHLFSRAYVAVGEIGIDLYWDKTFVEQQKAAFKQQCLWAKELNIPVAIHARDSFNEIFEVLDEVNDKNLTGVLHCFTGDAEQAQRVLNYGGFKLGIGGVVTFKKAGLDKVLESVDISNLVLETDSPYLAPSPYRGKRNESSYLVNIADKLSDIYQISLEEVGKITTQNALELFTRLK